MTADILAMQKIMARPFAFPVVTSEMEIAVGFKMQEHRRLEARTPMQKMKDQNIKLAMEQLEIDCDTVLTLLRRPRLESELIRGSQMSQAKINSILRKLKIDGLVVECENTCCGTIWERSDRLTDHAQNATRRKRVQ